MPVTRASTISAAASPSRALTPMPPWQTALFFGIPTVLIALGFLVLLPALQGQSMSRMVAFTLVDVVFVGGLAPAALIAMALEGRPLNWVSVRTRLRLKPITNANWNWLLFGILAFVGTYYAGIWLVGTLVKQFGLTFPDTTYPVDAGSTLNRVLWFVNIVVGLVSEELWWRGYVLPRQELVHGQRTWILHGLLWALVHVGYSGWFSIALVIPSLVLSFIAQGLRSTSPGLAMQAVLNIMNVILGGF
jgi:Type II CAAX prenyl endopeptidase Rce1-like